MTNEDAIKWLENLKQDIGQLRHEDLWHYEQAIYEIIELLKNLEDLEDLENVRMKASEQLLNLENCHIEVFKNPHGVCVCYRDCDVLDYPCRKSEFGSGLNFEEACENYLNKISGKTLVFGYGNSRKEIIVL